ncbi:hypothetical protein [Roseibium sp.]|nr:hypothetical protein [Roseibium sp.]
MFGLVNVVNATLRETTRSAESNTAKAVKRAPAFNSKVKPKA